MGRNWRRRVIRWKFTEFMMRCMAINAFLNAPCDSFGEVIAQTEEARGQLEKESVQPENQTENKEVNGLEP